MLRRPRALASRTAGGSRLVRVRARVRVRVRVRARVRARDRVRARVRLAPAIWPREMRRGRAAA